MSLLKEREARERAGGFSSSTMRKWRINGKGPAYLKLGRAIRYRSSDIDEWVDARRVRSTSERSR